MVDISYAFKNVYWISAVLWATKGFSTDTAGGLKVGENCQRWEKLIQGELFEQHQEQFMYKNAKALLERIGAI